MANHKIEMTEGCVSYCYLIDDKDFDNYSDESLMNMIKSLIEKLSIQKTVNYIIDVLDSWQCIENNNTIGTYKMSDKFATLWSYIAYCINVYYNVEKNVTDNSVIDGMNNYVSSLTEEDGKELKAYLTDIVINIVGEDRGWIEQFLQNLVRNDNDTKYESLGRCEECGDYIEKYTLKL
jgi:hypothetical protein